MEKFEVSYRLEDDEDKSLVAQLVPHERPDTPWQASTNLPAGIRSMSLVCQLSEPAPGLMPWLTVRHHRATTGRHWRTGVFLTHPIAAYASDALLELQDDRRLRLEVRAPSPDLFFNVLRDSIEDLVGRRWPGLTYDLLIPCRTTQPDKSRCPGEFKLRNLVRFRELGRTDIDCQECAGRLDIAQLLTGFAVSSAPLQPELERLAEEVARIGEGVDRIEQYAADAADSARRVLKAVGTEVTDCPRMFTLTPKRTGGFRRIRIDQSHHILTLWCEHPGAWHSCPEAVYDIDQPKHWLITVQPYAELVLKTLRVVLPVTKVVAELSGGKRLMQRAERELDLMKTLVDQI